MALELSQTGEILFLVGRVLFGAVVAFTGLNHFMDTESMVGYAEAKGVPAAGLMVPLTGGMLVFGGLSVALGAYPILGAAALAAFFVVTTPKMHDFWNVDDPEAKQGEMNDFLKNTALLATSLLLLALGGQAWPYALGLGL